VLKTNPNQELNPKNHSLTRSQCFGLAKRHTKMKVIFESIFSGLLIFLYMAYVWPTENILGFVVLTFLFFPFGSFILAPFMRLDFFFRFHSDILCVMLPNKDVYELHLANHFDLISFSRKIKNNVKKRIICEVIDGLLDICHEIENKTLPESLKIRAVTYFINKRTFERLGFQTASVNPIKCLVFAFDYVGIFISNYFVTGRFKCINIFKVRKATITGKELMANKNKLLNLRSKLGV
jgi:hypothetical protein